MARDFEAAGLEIPSVLCYHQLSSASEGWPDEYAEHISSHLAIGAALGARAIRIFGSTPPPVTAPTSWSRAPPRRSPRRSPTTLPESAS